MLRSTIICALFALAAGCATSQGVQVRASTGAGEVSDELDCMSECLESGDADCEICARQCLTFFFESATLVEMPPSRSTSMSIPHPLDPGR